MFNWASSFNQDIGDWAIYSVMDMRYIFYKASAFNQDLGWCVDGGMDLMGSFDNTPCYSTSCGVTKGSCP